MASGRSNQLAKQISESLVVAELGLRGHIATSFSGNVPTIDVIAITPKGRSYPIQVKAKRRGDWQLDIRNFLNIDISSGAQVIKGKSKAPSKDLIYILVSINEEGPADFYILRWRSLQSHFARTYKPRKPPSNIEKYHCIVALSDVARHKNKWSVLDK